MSLNVSRNSSFLHFGRRFIAYTLPPRMSQLPTSSRMFGRFSIVIDGCYEGLALFTKSIATVFGLKKAECPSVPGTNASDGMHPLGSDEAKRMNAFSYSGESYYSDLESGCEQPSTELKSGSHDLKELDQSQSILWYMNALSPELDSPYSPGSGSVVPSAGVQCSFKNKSSARGYRGSTKCQSSAQSAGPRAVEGVACPPEPLLASIVARSAVARDTYKRVSQYSGMRTLKLPGKQMRPMKALNETQIALRQIDEELAIEASKLDAYCARELAGDGVFVQYPAAKSQPGAMLYPRTARRIFRETSVGPVNPSWSGRSRRDIPTIMVSKPDDTRIKKTTVESSNLTPGHVAHPSHKAPAFLSTYSSSSVYDSPFGPAEERSISSMPQPSKPTGFDRKQALDRAKRTNKNRTSMSDWLETLSTGSNCLVAEHVATKAASVLRASLAISPSSTPPLSPADSTSSSDSSTPSTPVDCFFLPLPLVEKEEAVYAGDRQSRARCSYLGDGYEVVVAPAIPDELVTDEIGVAF